MAVMHAVQEVRGLLRTALVTALLVAALASCGGSGSDVAIDSTADGWKTIESQGLQVDIPAGWTRAAMQSCEFQFERWAPPDLPACSPDGGVAFYPSATFDPKHAPGIRHDDSARDVPDWAGYVYAGDFAVYAADDDRGLVQRVLRSARPASGE
jgi:hypothetical protein